MEYLKKAAGKRHGDESETCARVRAMLDELEAGGESTAREMAQRFDRWSGEIVVPPEAIAAAAAGVPDQIKADIAFAHDRVRRFAEAQLASQQAFEIELAPGFTAGQRLIPMRTAGCYVPGGRFAHIASAIMSVTTARVAGVETVIACSPPRGPEGIHPAVLYALDLCGADTVLTLGGVQGIGAMAFGHFTGTPVDILVGPGNPYVAEAKRILYGRCAIDMVAGPSEILVIADETADPELVAIDLVGQAEHGPDTSAWLITTCRPLAERVLQRVPDLIPSLPPPNGDFAATAWRDHGEVVLVSDREEAVRMSDAYAPEHLEVHGADLDWWLGNLRNFGSLFLGEETTVAFADKTSGPNHILPTRAAAAHTGGLSVGKFIKTVTHQRMSREANRDLAPVTARISRFEGMEAHARTADARLRKYFPNEGFKISV